MKTINYSEKFKVTLIATLIGLIAGIVSIAFNKILGISFDAIQVLFSGTTHHLYLPFIAALIIAFIRNHLLHKENLGFGVAQVMFEIEHIRHLEMKPKEVFYKTIGTIITLLAGFSAGRQGPIVHLGGAIGANIAYATKRTDNEKRVLIGCGVAGCLAGVFNSPIFATLFVVEILFKKRYFDMISTILLSALTSTLIVRSFENNNFLGTFIADYTFKMSEMPLFIVLGIVVGGVAIVYVLTLQGIEKWFNKLKISLYLKMFIAATSISFSLYFVNTLYFYNVNPTTLLTTHHPLWQLIGITILYILLTAITMGAGGLGGIFAPGLFIGLTSGLALSQIFTLLNIPILDAKTYAIAGMAAMFSGFAIAPLAGALMIVELTGQYHLLFPVLVCTLISSKFSEAIIGESIYHQKLNNLLKIEQ